MIAGFEPRDLDAARVVALLDRDVLRGFALLVGLLPSMCLMAAIGLPTLATLSENCRPQPWHWCFR